ncbi:MAG: hypothetical protein IJ733_12125 [Lachnospiraceae bacterium]|nr:hypothetical protein [Lachnospiraceae bacterium]
MVNEEKIKIMTGIALDESKRYKEEIAEAGYFKGDYIRSHVTSAIWNITIAYFLVIVLIVLYRADYILVNITKLSYPMLIGAGLGFYFLFCLITGLLSTYYYSVKYNENMIILKEYNHKLKQLKEFYSEAREETKDDTTTGI